MGVPEQSRAVPERPGLSPTRGPGSPGPRLSRQPDRRLVGEHADLDVLRAQAVVSCADRDNLGSRAVMQRIGMRRAGEVDPYAVSVLLRADWTAALTRASASTPASTMTATMDQPMSGVHSRA
jgi:hypothetical protein